LRLWEAGLWRAAGSWEEARVDLRRAVELGASRDLLAMASLEQPPERLNIKFYGVAPDLRWTGFSHTPDVLPQMDPIPQPGAVSTNRWFEHHVEKDHTIRAIAREGNHAVQYAGNETLSATEYTGAKAAAWTVRAAGVAIGGALAAGALYLISQGGGGGQGAGELIAIPVAIGAGIWKLGSEMDREFTRYVKEDERRKQERLRTYRLVRFLPRFVALDSQKDGCCARQVTLRNGVNLEHAL
jgi:hypothetical protein